MLALAMFNSDQVPLPSALNLATYSLPSSRYLSPITRPPVAASARIPVSVGNVLVDVLGTGVVAHVVDQRLAGHHFRGHRAFVGEAAHGGALAWHEVGLNGSISTTQPMVLAALRKSVAALAPGVMSQRS